MKEVNLLNSSADNFSSRLPIFKSDHMYQNQGRTFGPLLGLFLVNLFAKAVAAKYDSYFPFHLSLDPSPWLAYNRPLASYNYHTHYPQWYPVKNPYNYEPPLHQTYPTLTTAAPHESSQYVTSDADYESNYVDENDYYDTTSYPNEIDGLIPAESKNSIKSEKPPKIEVTTIQPEENIPTSNTIEEPIAAETSLNTRRQQSQRYKRRRPTKRNKYSQKRRRTTTPPAHYYDESYEDYTERYSSNRRRPSDDSYYDDDDDDEYYDSFEATTKYYKNKKRRPTRRPIKNQNRKRIPPDVSYETDSDSDKFGAQTEIVIVRQAVPTTPPTTTSEQPTFITNGTTTTTESSANTTGTTNQTAIYGYGPSNGNEEISFTYGPPVSKYQYQIPYFDWYSQENARNAIVKRVRDIVSYDQRYRVQK